MALAGRRVDYLADSRTGRLPIASLKQHLARSGKCTSAELVQATTKFALVSLAEAKDVDLEEVLADIPPSPLPSSARRRAGGKTQTAAKATASPRLAAQAAAESAQVEGRAKTVIEWESGNKSRRADESSRRAKPAAVMVVATGGGGSGGGGAGDAVDFLGGMLAGSVLDFFSSDKARHKREAEREARRLRAEAAELERQAAEAMQVGVDTVSLLLSSSHSLPYDTATPAAPGPAVGTGGGESGLRGSGCGQGGGGGGGFDGETGAGAAEGGRLTSEGGG